MHILDFTDEALSDMQSLNDEALKCLNRNFIQLVRNGYEPHELPGRYKPSWEAKKQLSVFHSVFIDKAKQLNLWHYHFGYEKYDISDDQTYPGDVSDAIAHTKRIVSGAEEIHKVIQICLEHPSPFKIPWERISESEDQ